MLFQIIYLSWKMSDSATMDYDTTTYIYIIIGGHLLF